MNKKRAIGGFVLSLVFLLFFVYTVSGAQILFESAAQGQKKEVLSGSISTAVQTVAPENTVPDVVKPDPEPQPDPQLEANTGAAISIETNLSYADKTLFEKDGETKLPIASLTKLMTAMIVLDNYNLSDSITIDKDADSQDPMKQDVKLGDIMPAESFLEIMLIKSSNKSAYALSEKMGEQTFVSLMNKKAKEIGLENTFFADPTGLSSENVSTASDLVKLAEYILKNYPRIADISRTKEFNVPGFGQVENTDELLGEIPEIVCSKTGFTNQAKGCLLLVINNTKNSDYLINVVLGADDRFAEMKKIVDWQNKACN